MAWGLTVKVLDKRKNILKKPTKKTEKDEKKVTVTMSSPSTRYKVEIKIKFPEGYENGYWPKKDKRSNQL